MIPALEAALRDLGATIVDGAVRDFGDPAAELAAVAQGDHVADLSHFGVIEFSGPDTTEFLHNQLSCDVKGLAADSSSYGSYCTPKGRMLATFLLWKERDAWRMLLPRTILPAIAKRLRMFVLRSKVTVVDTSDAVALLGAGGPTAGPAVEKICGGLPSGAHGSAALQSGGSVLSLPGSRWLLVLPVEQAAPAWTAMAKTLRAAGTAAWDWTDVRNGIAFVGARTQEQFVPQMANLELIGGVSFKKGCYPGQEIVARTQHLGKVKRRLYLANVKGDAKSGDELFGEDVAGQANGLVASAAPSPNGGTDVLAVVQSASVNTSRVHWRSADGPLLEFQPLPYSLP